MCTALDGDLLTIGLEGHIRDKPVYIAHDGPARGSTGFSGTISRVSFDWKFPEMAHVPFPIRKPLLYPLSYGRVSLLDESVSARGGRVQSRLLLRHARSRQGSRGSVSAA